MPRCFAIVPACGHSTRMGRPKLLLPLDGKPLVLHVADAWRRGGASAIVAVVRRDDTELAALLEGAGADVVLPAMPPPDMKASVAAALKHVESRFSPTAADAFLVAPADMPGLSPEIISQLISKHGEQPEVILAPTLGGRRGHPVLFPWLVAPRVQELHDDEGLNALAARHPFVEIACDGLVADLSRPFADIDTPEQYRSARGE